MRRVIKETLISDDPWRLTEVAEADFTPQAGQQYVLPLALWQTYAPEFKGFDSVPGVWLDADIELEPVAEVISQVPLIAVRFPSFTDGSGFSTGSLIREVFAFNGELRAFGSLLSDQLGYLRRCGYDSVALPEDQDTDTAIAQFKAVTVSYQGDVLRPTTPFRRRIE